MKRFILNFKKIESQIKCLLDKKNRGKIPIAVVCVGLFFIFLLTISYCSEEREKSFYKTDKITFRGGRVLDSGKSIQRRSQELFSKKLGKTNSRISSLDRKLKMLNESIKSLEEEIQKSKSNGEDQKEIDVSAPLNKMKTTKVKPKKINGMRVIGSGVEKRNLLSAREGSSIISFPPSKRKKRRKSVVKLPSGSFVKAKLLTGIDAIKKPLPVLLQADFAFVGPNNSRIDLSGCFLIAKSSSNLLIERAEMQATKLSCVSKSGKMFERKINGYVADSEQSTFGVSGEVKSKQGRVATMAFLSSVVEGVGKAVQQSQMTGQVTPLGGSNSILTGDQGKYIAAGGVSNAASQVTKWYLNNAQNLEPSISIKPAQDVFVIIQESVELPNWYFKKTKPSSSSASYLYLSRAANK